ncbi:Quinate permease [Fusarium oxysporum f. sp. albedinis]|nr:Quinate permease [Fusarium oxysporum f. sp. albedinis]
MKASDILRSNAGNERRNIGVTSSNKLPTVEYSLRVRQQPVAARSCGFGERDRRVIDPPPIIQLTIKSPNLTRDEIDKQLRNNHYIMSCSIYDESGSQDATFISGGWRQERQLLGVLISTPFVGEDEYGEEGCFFCFQDLSCRTPGSFRLKFSLTRIDPARAREVGHFPVLAEDNSDIFTVYTAKDFPGMQASTKLLKRLKEQGCIVPIRKGNDWPRNARSHDYLHDEE